MSIDEIGRYRQTSIDIEAAASMVPASSCVHRHQKSPAIFIAGFFLDDGLGSVVIAAFAVEVAVLEFLGGGGADAFDLDVEDEGESGEGVVAVDGDFVAVDA